MVQFLPTGHPVALLAIVAMLLQSCVAVYYGRPWASAIERPPGPGGIGPILAGPRPPPPRPDRPMGHP
ncbi:hypothetical protein PTTG_26223 [Puccinia triticina 1-1 BBBD Race 1]|uniref:Uncharacterized protein n=1 Tax=Puccinia triticina (isolate 1-1 / race 1 (BBBD)) TaxID=630390 RepID=A0A180GVD0_PUCT1|nr:hypothetical protein PTTG_26223 [Puccinia triticina 1-1 BBBD Race 1]